MGSQHTTSGDRSRSKKLVCMAGIATCAMVSGVQPSLQWTERIGRKGLSLGEGCLQHFAGPAEHTERRARGAGELQEIEEKIRTSTFKLDSFLWELTKVPENLHKLVS